MMIQVTLLIKRQEKQFKGFIQAEIKKQMETNITQDIFKCQLDIQRLSQHLEQLSERTRSTNHQLSNFRGEISEQPMISNTRKNFQPLRLSSSDRHNSKDKEQVRLSSQMVHPKQEIDRSAHQLLKARKKTMGYALMTQLHEDKQSGSNHQMGRITMVTTAPDLQSEEQKRNEEIPFHEPSIIRNIPQMLPTTKNIKINHLLPITYKNEQSLVDQRSFYYPKFQVIHQQIKLLKSQRSIFCPYYQLLGRKSIHQKSINKFRIFTPSSVWFGVINQKYITDRSSYHRKRKECIIYQADTGTVSISHQNKYMGRPCKIDDEVIMEVRGKLIQWKIKNQLKIQIIEPMLIDRTIKWVPCVLMKDERGYIQWQ